MGRGGHWGHGAPVPAAGAGELPAPGAPRGPAATAALREGPAGDEALPGAGEARQGPRRPLPGPLAVSTGGGGGGRVSVTMVTRGAAPPLPETAGEGRCWAVLGRGFLTAFCGLPRGVFTSFAGGSVGTCGGERGPVGGRERGASWPRSGSQAPCVSTAGHGGLRPKERLPWQRMR